MIALSLQVFVAAAAGIAGQVSADLTAFGWWEYQQINAR
jgi:hypothetical protein